MEDKRKIIDSVAIGDDLLTMNNITKIYPNGFVANNGVNFSVRKGEIHGLVGENGAGKTTLMKVLFGLETAESGTVQLGGTDLNISSPLEALDYGIGMVHQHFMLIESLTVAENMALGHEPTKGLSFDMKSAVSDVEAVSLKYGLKVDPKSKVMDLSVGLKQRVEILKMLLHGAKILLLDEPTAVLTPQETEELFVELQELKKLGYSIVFISHKLNEVKAICDRITVLRDGESVTTEDVSKISEQEISNLMVGRNIDLNIKKKKAEPKHATLKVRNVSYKNQFEKQILNDISFNVRAGEILGVAGVEGNGQSELADILSGLKDAQSGDILVENAEISNDDVYQLRERGVAIIHEDRMSIGAAVTQSISDNIISDRFDEEPYTTKHILQSKTIKQFVEGLIQDFKIKCDGESALVRTLSGGNIQKVVAAREFTSEPKLLIACQPTRGIDVGAADLIRRKMIRLRDELDTAVLLFSADLTELLSTSDSIIVMNEGEIVAYFEDLEHVNEEVLGEYMLGLKKQSVEEISEVMSNERN